MKYAVLGAGKMAMALIQGALRANLCSASEITVSSRSRPGLENLAAATGVCAAASNAEAVAAAETVLLCVKPSDIPRKSRHWVRMMVEDERNEAIVFDRTYHPSGEMTEQIPA